MNASDHGLPVSAADALERPPVGRDAFLQPREPILDLQVLEALRALPTRNEPDMLQRVLCLFLGHAPGLLAALRENLARQDAKGVAAAAHALKSSSGNLGAARLSELCAVLEERGRNESMDGMREVLAALEMEYANALTALSDYVGAP